MVLINEGRGSIRHSIQTVPDDVTFCFPQVFGSLKWEVRRGLGSTHLPILVSICRGTVGPRLEIVELVWNINWSEKAGFCRLAAENTRPWVSVLERNGCVRLRMTSGMSGGSCW